MQAHQQLCQAGGCGQPSYLCGPRRGGRSFLQLKHFANSVRDCVSKLFHAVVVVTMVTGDVNDWIFFSSAVSVWSNNSAVSKTPAKGMTAVATISCPNCSACCCCRIMRVIWWPLHFRIDGVFVNGHLSPVLLTLLPCS